jgi:hypothetical protein
MKAFVVSVNGQPFLTAGVGDKGVLSSHITWSGGTHGLPDGERLYLHVGGLDSRSGEHVRWSVPDIGVGDEITIKIIETDQVTPEDERFRTDVDRMAAVSERVVQGMREGRDRRGA